MTNEEIDSMPAGPEMDALIATEIFGAIPLTDNEWEIAQGVYLMNHGAQAFPLACRFIKIPLNEPQYGTGLMFRLDWPRGYSRDQYGSSAVIVEKMRADGWLFSLHDGIGDSPYRCAQFSRERDATAQEIEEKKAYRGRIFDRGEGLATEDALAICRAALNAVRQWKKRTIDNSVSC